VPTVNDSLLDQILKDEFEVADIPVEAIPALMIKLAGVQANLQSQLLTAGPEVDNLLNAEAVAGWFGVKEDYVRELGRRGEIPTVQIGKYVRFERSAVHDWIEQHRDKPFHSDHKKRENRKR